MRNTTENTGREKSENPHTLTNSVDPSPIVVGKMQPHESENFTLVINSGQTSEGHRRNTELGNPKPLYLGSGDLESQDK